MGKEFFNDWVLWQKMTFVLACAIVVAIGCGLIKLWWETYKIRHYTKVAAANKGKATEISERGKERSTNEEADVGVIPFGIRAIESGIEVDGVWISRSNTPAPSSPVSSASSFVNEPLSGNHSRTASYTDLSRIPRAGSHTDLSTLPLGGSQSELPRIAMPQPVHGATSRASSRAPSSSFDRAVSTEPVPGGSRSSSPGIGSLTMRPARQHQPPPASYSRYSNSVALRNSGALEALEGYTSSTHSRRLSDEAVRYHDAFETSQKASSESGQRRSSSDDSSTKPQTRPVDKRIDLDLLQSHRMSHVAETGQLTPRVRRPVCSGDWASVNSARNSEAGDYFVPRRSSPSPPSNDTNPFGTPETEPSTPYSGGAHTTNVTQQSQSLLQTYQPAGPHFDKETPPMSFDSNDVEASVGAPQPVASFQHQHDSQVLRKVNSGFEILRPGTFGPPQIPLDLDMKDLEWGEKRQSRRLQKKRRPSNGSKTSSFVEAV